MSWQRKVISTLALLMTIIATGLAYVMNVYKTAPVNPTWELSPGNKTAGAVTVRYSGTATLLFDDGKTRWIVDGWFSRPNALQLALGKIEPNMANIDYGLSANKIDMLAAVIPIHSHFDHAMDAPEVAKRTGALLIGSESTANIARGWGLSESQIKVAVNREPIHVGEFVITPIESRHFEFSNPVLHEQALSNPKITTPLNTPAKALDYRVGKVYVLHVSHPKGSWVIVGSAGFEKDGLNGFQADTLFLGIGGLGSQTVQYREDYWAETVGQVSPNRIIPIHYDSLTSPISGPMQGPSLAEFFLAGGLDSTKTFLQEKEASDPTISFNTLPRFKEIVLYP
ncbi:MAG TPA: MBL fold metallo-hydrolase [Porticoccus sp.]|nr:MBL fold metallo-hydrolase [Porticoccus sp.]